MAIFTKQFPDSDQYENWLQEAGDRISVLKISNSPPMNGSSTQSTTGPISVTYEIDDESLAPARSRTAIVAQAVIIGALFFALFLFLISKI